jgi:hypothetical protein
VQNVNHPFTLGGFPENTRLAHPPDRREQLISSLAPGTKMRRVGAELEWCAET